MADVTLSANVRNSLLALSNSQQTISARQNRLSTGVRINSALDGPTAYFQAKSLNDRAADLNGLKDQMHQAGAVVGAAIKGANGIESLVNEAKAVVKQGVDMAKTKESAVKANDTAAADEATVKLQGITDQYNGLLKQIDQLSKDSSYNGKNLLAGGDDNTLTVHFGSKNFDSKLVVKSQVMDTSEKGLNLVQVSTFSTDEADRLKALDTATNTVQARVRELGTSAATISTRENFTKDYVNTLQEGSQKLTLADVGEEGANLLALQTRQQLGTQSLSLANQSQQAVMRLFG